MYIVQVQSLDILGSLPEIRPDYRPLPQRHYREENEHDPAVSSLVDPDMIGTKTTNQRRIYSGRKQVVTSVKKLFDLCMSVSSYDVLFVLCVMFAMHSA